MAADVPELSRKEKKVARLGWVVLAWNLAVIVWGAFVRASGSGAGCGRHWPLCNGEVVPRPQSLATVIEVTHRVTSGLALIAVVALLVFARRSLPRGHRVRRGAAISTFFVFAEAGLGAGLVLFELVAHDASMKRALSMSLHLGNTFFLLAALSLTAWWAETGQGTRAPRGTGEGASADAPVRTRSGGGALGVVVSLALVSVLLLGASGAVAALGDTLFPATSLREGLAQDLSPLSHVFLKLRMLHPVLALGAGILTLGAAGLVRAISTSDRARALSRGVTVVFVIQFAAGLLNITLLAPIGMQLVHLLLADATWILLVLMSWEAVRGAAPAPRPATTPAPSTPDVAAA